MKSRLPPSHASTSVPSMCFVLALSQFVSNWRRTCSSNWTKEENSAPSPKSFFGGCHPGVSLPRSNRSTRHLIHAEVQMFTTKSHKIRLGQYRQTQTLCKMGFLKLQKKTKGITEGQRHQGPKLFDGLCSSSPVNKHTNQLSLQVEGDRAVRAVQLLVNQANTKEILARTAGQLEEPSRCILPGFALLTRKTSGSQSSKSEEFVADFSIPTDHFHSVDTTKNQKNRRK